jgi:signal transduction histidine kinase
MKRKGSFTYVYVGLFLSAVLAILIVNSYILIDRTRSNLIEIYWKQGELIVKTIAYSARQSIGTVELTPQQVNRHIKKTALKIDEADERAGGITQADLDDLLIETKLKSIAILDASGTPRITATGQDDPDKDFTIPAENEKLQEFDHLPKQITIKRQKQPGAIRLTLTPRKFVSIRTRIGLQILIASLENHNIIQSITFIDNNFRVIGDSDPNRLGMTEEEPEYLDVLKSGVSYYFRDSDEGIITFIHPLNYTNDSRGILKIAYPIARIDSIYKNIFKNVIVNSGVVFLIAIIAAIIAVKLNNRNLDKIELMEKKIRENEKLASLANLTAGVAHEIRNPLNSVSIIIQRLQFEFTPNREEDLEEYGSLTDLLKQEVDRINLIITDFLDFAKPFEPKKSEFNINEFIREGFALMSPEAEENGVNLIINTGTDDVSFLGDQEKLTQVLINILRNAIEASARYDTITIESHITHSKQWLLEIKDDGMGIPKENLNHIFDIYFTTKKTGTGLGLYICRKIIRAHKGNIDLWPNPSSGITVSIQLPFLEY